MSSETPQKMDELRRRETQIEHTRGRLERYVTELDRRRHALMNARRSPAVWSVGIAAITAAAGGIGYAVWSKQRKKHRPTDRARRLYEGLRLLSRDPERVSGAEPPIWRKLVVAAGVAAVTKLAHGLASRAVGEGASKDRNAKRS
jgi:hypothetical protein